MSKDENLYRFGDITIDIENFRVQKDGQIVTLTPRAFDVLIFLLRNNGRVVEKQELFGQVWKDNYVSDNALTKIIKEIRHTLTDSADTPRYIETVQKRGYRFIGEVEGKFTEDVQDTHPTAQRSLPIALSRFTFSHTHLALSAIVLMLILAATAWILLRQKPAQTPLSLVRSLAVLPFKPLDADSRDESLEMGMAETLITRLSSLKQVAVRPMSAVRKYTDLQQDPVKAGEEIQVEAVLDGSIQKAGERVRVTVRLISVQDGTPIWSERFDENFTDIFKVQDSIAERVTNALTLQLSGEEKQQLAKHLTDSPEAYQLYLHGQLVWHRRRQNWIEQSLAYYQQTLAQDPNFALAYIGVADCYIMMNGHHLIPASEAETKARPGIMKALEIDGTLAQAHNALAELKYQYEYDWTGAEKEFKKAIDLNPNVAWIHQAYGWFLMSVGRFDEANDEMERAQGLDPSSLTINVGRGRLFYYSRQYDQAIQQFQNIIAVEPDEGSSYQSLYTIYEQKQMYPEAVEAYLKFKSLNGARPSTIDGLREAFRMYGWQGFLLKQLEGLEQSAKTDYVEPSVLRICMYVSDEKRRGLCLA